MDQLGAVAGLAAAASFALASVFYVRVPIGAGAMTTFKNTLAMFFLFVALIVVTLTNRTAMFTASLETWWDIGISGIFGLCLADIAYFRSLQILGPRRGLTLTLLTPPLTALLSAIWLGEILAPIVWGSIVVTLVGIAIVMWERTDRAPEQEIRPGSMRWGVTCAFVGIVISAVGSVILKRGTDHIGTVEATFIRLLVASVFGILLSAATGQLREIRVLMKDRVGLKNLCIASVIGTVVGVWFLLVAYKYRPAGVASTLTSTTPLFVIPIVWYFNRQRISLPAIIGAFVAFAGVCGLLWNR